MEIFSLKENFKLAAIEHLVRIVFKVGKQPRSGSILLCVLDFSEESHVTK
jgi:hypothetical protein